MLSLNTDKNIISYIKKSDKIISCISLNDTYHKEGFNELDLENGFTFQLAPRPVKEKERSVLFVAGESGAGKSYFVREYAKEYHKMFPKNPIYLISYLEHDETLDTYNKIKRIKAFDFQFLEECMDIDLKEEFSDTMVIFDDIDSITNKKVKEKIYGFLNKILRIGRHFNISVCCAFHELYASHEIKAILNEAHSITFFPKFLNFKKIRYLLEIYLGLSKSQIEKIRSIKNSRSITYIKGSDKIILTEKEIFLIDNYLEKK